MPAAAEPDPALVARLRAAGCVFGEREARLLVAEAAGDQGRLEAMARRREDGEPLEVVVGWAELAGARVALEPGVFVPRERSELLVAEAIAALDRIGDGASDDAPGRLGEAAADDARQRPGAAASRATVLDLCCGSGAVGAAIATARPGIELHAADLDRVATALAARNLARFDARIYRGDLFEALPDALRGGLDLIVANTPYVPSGELELMPREARLYEPAWALDGGADGLDPLRRIAAGAPDWLRPGGAVLVEAAIDTAEDAAAIVTAAGLTARIARSRPLEVAVVIGVIAERPL